MLLRDPAASESQHRLGRYPGRLSSRGNSSNSIKYGALAAEAGVVDLTCVADGGFVVMVWKEQGGPPTAAPTAPLGFGSKLLSQSVTGQFQGAVAFDWPPEGIVVTMRMNKGRLAA